MRAMVALQVAKLFRAVGATYSSSKSVTAHVFASLEQIAQLTRVCAGVWSLVCMRPNVCDEILSSVELFVADLHMKNVVDGGDL